MSAADGGARTLYLHTGGRSLRVRFKPPGPGDGPLDGPPEGPSPALPLGPQHRVRLMGRIDDEPELPVLWASSAQLLRSERQ